MGSEDQQANDPASGAGAAAQWRGVCAVEAIPRLGARRIERSGYAPVAVFRADDGAVFALVDRCPHKGGPLSQGIVFGHNVACPLHNWTIGLADGCAAAPDTGCTPRIAVRVTEGTVELDFAQFEPLPAPPVAAGALP
jgi:nitrite reductase (NADH) small subunit